MSVKKVLPCFVFGVILLRHTGGVSQALKTATSYLKGAASTWHESNSFSEASQEELNSDQLNARGGLFAKPPSPLLTAATVRTL
jgi:fructose-bisphosphate aldolase class 1